MALQFVTMSCSICGEETNIGQEFCDKCRFLRSYCQRCKIWNICKRTASGKELCLKCRNECRGFYCSKIAKYPIQFPKYCFTCFVQQRSGKDRGCVNCAKRDEVSLKTINKNLFLMLCPPAILYSELVICNECDKKLSKKLSKKIYPIILYNDSASCNTYPVIPYNEYKSMTQITYIYKMLVTFFSIARQQIQKDNNVQTEEDEDFDFVIVDRQASDQ